MNIPVSSVALAGAVAAAAFTSGPVRAATEDLGGGFRDHGVATPVSNHRGIVATRDGAGRDVVLIWLYDRRGAYAVLMVDVDAGTSRQIATPFPPRGDCPYASLLSSRNRYYTHFAGCFAEFDPVKGAFTFWKATKPQMAMGMTEDDAGRIWAVTYPNSGVVCFDPETRKLRDYGYVHKENWRQYQRYVAADDTGWVYFAIGNTASQIVAFDPKTAETRTVVPEKERIKGSAWVGRDQSGKVYGRNGKTWYELYRGMARKIAKPAQMRLKPIITGSQGLVHRNFPDGRRLKVCDTVERFLVVDDPKTGTSRRITFDYTSEGAHIMGIAAAADGTLCGGTAFPMRFFSYNPKTDTWINRAAYGQWNTVAPQGDRFFVGGYGGGFLLEWVPARPWVPTVRVGTRPETIGWGYTDPDYYHFKGMIGEVRIYDRALTADELAKPPADGAAACWLFDEGEKTVASDSSGNRNHAAIQGAEWTRDGTGGHALKFDGKDDHVEAPDSPSLHVRDALTVVARVYPTPPHQRGYGGIINNLAGHANSRLLILNNGETLAQVFINGKTGNAVGPRVRNNAWNQVAYVYDGAHEYWVVNGVQGRKFPRTGSVTLDSNPEFLTDCHPDINRPHDLLACPDERTVVLAGTPGYGYTGGGLLFWDRKTRTRVLRTHKELLPEQATLSLAPLPDGKIIGGSTTSPGTGGEKKAKQAELYILDLKTKRIEWHEPLFPGAQGYTDLCPGPRGLIYGVVDRKRFFVFDPAKRSVVHESDTNARFGPTNSQQGPRVFVRTPQGDVYMLFVKGIARIDPESFAVRLTAKSPVPIGPGGDFLDGRIYFGSGSHLYSWELPAVEAR